MKRHALALAVIATITALVLSGCGDDDEPTNNADDPASTPASDTSDPTPTDVATTPSEEPEPSETDTGSTDTLTTSVFFVADTPQGPHLFAEQREVEADNPPAEALALLMAGDVLDADYGTLVPAGSLVPDSGFDGMGDDGTFSLTLSGEAWTERPDGISRDEAELAVQQVVYTLLTLAGEGDKEGMTGHLIFMLDNQEVSFLGVDSGVQAADELDARGLVNVLSPAEGTTLSGTFTAAGEASSFEATVPWQVRDESGKKVLDGFATADGWIDGLYPWESEVDVSSLAPGTYTFVAMTDDPSGGEGPGPTEDTKTIVVE
jgi:hypothetical protein